MRRKARKGPLVGEERTIDLGKAFGVPFDEKRNPRMKKALYVVKAVPVTISSSGKIKRVKRGRHA
jgi:hypothetical protein